MTDKDSSPADGQELLPCPFCGNTDDEVGLYEEDNPGDRHFVRCHVCLVETVRAVSREIAIAIWNRRSPPVSTSKSPEEIRNAALEEAAQIVEDEAFPSERARFGVAADTIRARKSTPTAPQEISEFQHSAAAQFARSIGLAPQGAPVEGGKENV